MDAITGAAIELPLYKCHKEVWALKIKAVEKITPTVKELQDMLDDTDNKIDLSTRPAARITPEDSRYAPFGVTKSYMDKHDPKPGGYWVQYDDGYQSFSPAEAFESGYTLSKENK